MGVLGVVWDSSLSIGKIFIFSQTFALKSPENPNFPKLIFFGIDVPKALSYALWRPQSRLEVPMVSALPVDTLGG